MDFYKKTINGLDVNIESEAGDHDAIIHIAKLFHEQCFKNGFTVLNSGFRINSNSYNALFVNLRSIQSDSFGIPETKISLKFEHVELLRDNIHSLEQYHYGGISIKLENGRESLLFAIYDPVKCILILPYLGFEENVEETGVHDALKLVFDSLYDIKCLANDNFDLLIRKIKGKTNHPTIKFKVGDFVMNLGVDSIESTADFEKEIINEAKELFGEQLRGVIKSNSELTKRLYDDFKGKLNRMSGFTLEEISKISELKGTIYSDGSEIYISVPADFTVSLIKFCSKTYQIPFELWKRVLGYWVFKYDMGSGDKWIINNVFFCKEPYLGMRADGFNFSLHHSVGFHSCLGDLTETMYRTKSLPTKELIERMNSLMITINWDSPLDRDPIPKKFWGDLTEWIKKCVINRGFFGLTKETALTSLEDQAAGIFVDEDGKAKKDDWNNHEEVPPEQITPQQRIRRTLRTTTTDPDPLVEVRNDDVPDFEVPNFEVPDTDVPDTEGERYHE